MSAIILSTVRRLAMQANHVKTSRVNRAPGFAGRMLMAAQRLFARFSYGFAQERIHRAAIERELYQGRYRHTSKNDDDLPIVR